MPLIRVDDEVHECLRNRGRTAETYNDVIRRELNLPPSPERSARGPVPATRNDPLLQRFVELLNKHLPKHWSHGNQRAFQIALVVAEYLKIPKNLTPAERFAKATRAAAKERNIDFTTVRDKCTRQLYETGAGRNQTGQFLKALEAIERDHREK